MANAGFSLIECNQIAVKYNQMAISNTHRKAIEHSSNQSQKTLENFENQSND